MGVYRTIELDRKGAVATLAFNRPDRMNGIINEMMRELYEALRSIEVDPRPVLFGLSSLKLR